MDPPQGQQENGDDGNHPPASPSSSSTSPGTSPGGVEDEHPVAPQEPPNGEAEEGEDEEDGDDSGGSDAEDGGDGDDGAAAEDDDDDDDDDEEDGPEVNALAHLPDYVLARVNKLRDLDSQRQELMDQYLVERAAVEKKFAGLFTPLYDERADVVRGAKDDEIAAAAAVAAEPKTAEPTSAVDVDAVEAARSAQEGDAPEEAERRSTGIPHFWVTAMCNHETVSEWVTESDVDCLEKLLNVTCVDHDDGKGFQLHFHFDGNEYFDNSVLTKTYEVPNLLLSDEPLLKGVRGTTIQWKPGRSLTYRMVKKKQRGKGKHAGLVRTVQKREETESFFTWFEPPEMPPMDSMDEDKAAELEAVFDEDYEMALVFRNQIIPRAVTWFTGDAYREDQMAVEVDIEAGSESESE